jgi:hypothetical protein
MEEAAGRAEQLRKKLSETPHSYLGNRRLTASFGVSQLEANDTPETLLRRSDQALLTAKEHGRNQVVQLGAAMQHSQRPKKKWWDFGLFRGEPLLQARLAMEVPMNVAVEKLRGFVTDHKARVISTRENRVEFEISSENIGQYRRKGDRPVLFRVELELAEQRIEKTNTFGLASGTYAHTEAEVAVRPKRRRDRRRTEQLDRARLVMQSLKGYLMAKDLAAIEEENETAVFTH